MRYLNLTRLTVAKQKKNVRRQFRDAVFSRDRYCCRACGAYGSTESELDAHHITDRNEMPDGGYVIENGISLCSNCHGKAEQFHSTGTAADGFSPNQLYSLIGSSKRHAEDAARKTT